MSGNFVVLSFARLLAGLGAAAGFVGGGALAATIAQSRPERANFLLSLFYAGPGIGILSSGLIAPFVLQAFGPGSWWIVWWAMTLLSVAMTVPLLLAPINATAGIADAAAAPFAIRPVLIYLAGYFLFGAGYIAYMTFMIAYVRDAGGGAAAQSAFWSLIGLSAFATPWVWRRVLALDRGGLSTTIILGVNAIGAALPIFGHSPLLLAISALVFGVAFFAVVGSTTAFVRFNYPPAAWPAAIAAMTIAFGIGQTLGPIAVGAVTDAHGQPVLCAQRLGGDAGGRRDGDGVSGQVAYEDVSCNADGVLAMMTLRQVEVIRAVMVTGTIGGAARLLNVSAPGISRLVKYTEKSLGIRFFQRQNGRYFPTPEAQNIFEQINGVYKKVDDLTEIISKIGHGALSELRIGSVPSISQVMVPRAIERVRRRYPDLRIDINILKIEEAVDYLLLGRGDCVAMSSAARSLRPRFPAAGVGRVVLHRAHRARAGGAQADLGRGNHPLSADRHRSRRSLRPDHGRDLCPQETQLRHHHPGAVRHHGLRAGQGRARHRRDRSVHRRPWRLPRRRSAAN